MLVKEVPGLSVLWDVAAAPAAEDINMAMYCQGGSGDVRWLGVWFTNSLLHIDEIYLLFLFVKWDYKMYFEFKFCMLEKCIDCYIDKFGNDAIAFILYSVLTKA